MRTDKTFLFPGLILIITILSWISSCSHNANIDNIPDVCFERDILPIFQNNCAISGCHDGSSESDLNFTSYVPISHSVEPYKPYSSMTYKAITSTWGENKMPPDQPLSVAYRTFIRLWIEQGALLTTCTDTTVQHIDYVNPLSCFSRDILPVLTSKCASTGCHDAKTHAGDYVITNYSSVRNIVLPGNPSGSKLYQSITGSGDKDDKMPPPGKTQLTIAEIDSIASWITYGALNSICGETCDTINPVTFSVTIWPIIQTSCTGCHSGTSPSGGITLTNYTNVASAAANGSLMNSLKGTGVTKMPLGNSFTVCRIREFDLWVNNGYLNN